MKRVLSCSGGGIRGVITVEFLRLLEQKINKPLYEVFDMFVGTSSGGVIALGLGVKKMSMSEISIMSNYNNSQIVMDKSIVDKYIPIQCEPKYNGEGKSKILHKYFGNTKLYDTDKYVLVPVYNVEEKRIHVFKNTNGDYSNNLKIREIADGTTAAPVLYPTKNLSNGEWVVDGGLTANDPTMCAGVEALKLWKENIKILTVGTGISSRKIDGKASKHYGVIEWFLNGIVEMMMDTTGIDYQAKVLFGDNYMHINHQLIYANFELDDVSEENYNNLIKEAQRWFDLHGDEVIKFLELDK